MRIETIHEPKFHDDLPTALDKAKENIKHQIYPRKQLSAILQDYNQHLGNDAVALQNIANLQDPQSYCVVTGQQLGAFGGPVYTILKGISCLLLARQAGAIPIFWLATEDHDIAEIDHVYCVDDLGNLKRFHLSLVRDGTAVEDIKLTQKNVDEIAGFWGFFGLEESLPNAGESYGDWMAKMFKGKGQR